MLRTNHLLSATADRIAVDARKAGITVHPLAAGSKADAGAVETGALRVWRLPDADNAALLAHLRAGLETGAPEMRHPQDEVIIREARQRLAPNKNS